MDFTIKIYSDLFITLKNQGYSFFTFDDFISIPFEKGIVFRHDIDKLPENSLILARIENKFGIRGTYYFRIVPGCFDENIIKEIFSLGARNWLSL